MAGALLLMPEQRKYAALWLSLRNFAGKLVAGMDHELADLQGITVPIHAHMHRLVQARDQFAHFVSTVLEPILKSMPLETPANAVKADVMTVNNDQIKTRILPFYTYMFQFMTGCRRHLELDLRQMQGTLDGSMQDPRYRILKARLSKIEQQMEELKGKEIGVGELALPDLKGFLHVLFVTNRNMKVLWFKMYDKLGMNKLENFLGKELVSAEYVMSVVVADARAPAEAVEIIRPVIGSPVRIVRPVIGSPVRIVRPVIGSPVREGHIVRPVIGTPIAGGSSVLRARPEGFAATAGAGPSTGGIWARQDVRPAAAAVTGPPPARRPASSMIGASFNSSGISLPGATGPPRAGAKKVRFAPGTKFDGPSATVRGTAPTVSGGARSRVPAPTASGGARSRVPVPTTSGGARSRIPAAGAASTASGGARSRIPISSAASVPVRPLVELLDLSLEGPLRYQVRQEHPLALRRREDDKVIKCYNGFSKIDGERKLTKKRDGFPHSRIAEK